MRESEILSKYDKSKCFLVGQKKTCQVIGYREISLLNQFQTEN